MTSRTAWGLSSDTQDRLWQQNAACSPSTADWFWIVGKPGRGELELSVDNRLALNLCRHCPVQARCLADELQHPTPYPHVAGGRVWGLRA